jgi:hypothetical protein
LLIVVYAPAIAVAASVFNATAAARCPPLSPMFASAALWMRYPPPPPPLCQHAAAAAAATALSLPPHYQRCCHHRAINDINAAMLSPPPSLPRYPHRR